MCPLRLILIFLSATLAGLFVIRNLKSQPQILAQDDNDAAPPPVDRLSKARQTLQSAFWVLVDMASGRYLWRHLVSSKSSSSSSSSSS